MESVLQKIDEMLADNPEKREAAEGVVIAIYGADSIKNAQQAYDIVYSSCKL